jgi:hypothetical protein
MYAPYAVYTILHRDTLREIAGSGKVTPLNEKKRWVTGRDLFNEAQRKGQEMVILYADANECSKLLYWGKLTGIEVDSNGTRFSIAELTALTQKTTQELVLKSTKARIANGYIKPYAIVQTPSFIEKHAGRGIRKSSDGGVGTAARAFTQYWRNSEPPL